MPQARGRSWNQGVVILSRGNIFVFYLPNRTLADSLRWEIDFEDRCGELNIYKRSSHTGR